MIAVTSRDHVPTENGIYSTDLSKFHLSAHLLQESTLLVSTSDINLESKDPPIK